MKKNSRSNWKFKLCLIMVLCCFAFKEYPSYAIETYIDQDDQDEEDNDETKKEDNQDEEDNDEAKEEDNQDEEDNDETKREDDQDEEDNDETKREDNQDEENNDETKREDDQDEEDNDETKREDNQDEEDNDETKREDDQDEEDNDETKREDDQDEEDNDEAKREDDQDEENNDEAKREDDQDEEDNDEKPIISLEFINKDKNSQAACLSFCPSVIHKTFSLKKNIFNDVAIKILDKKTGEYYKTWKYFNDISNIEVLPLTASKENDGFYLDIYHIDVEGPTKVPVSYYAYATENFKFENNRKYDIEFYRQEGFMSVDGAEDDENKLQTVFNDGNFLGSIQVIAHEDIDKNVNNWQAGVSDIIKHSKAYDVKYWEDFEKSEKNRATQRVIKQGIENFDQYGLNQQISGNINGFNIYKPLAILKLLDNVNLARFCFCPQLVISYLNLDKNEYFNDIAVRLVDVNNNFYCKYKKVPNSNKLIDQVFNSDVTADLLYIDFAQRSYDNNVGSLLGPNEYATNRFEIKPNNIYRLELYRQNSSFEDNLIFRAENFIGNILAISQEEGKSDISNIDFSKLIVHGSEYDAGYWCNYRLLYGKEV